MTSTATIYRVTEKDWVPGPDKYQVPSDFGNNARKYTIGHRYGSKSSRGPGYENLPTTIGTGHKYSLSSRHQQGKQFITPAPDYHPPPIGVGAPASSFHQRLTPRERGGTPGPNYAPTFSGGKQWTMKARRFIDEEKPCSPGPGKYGPQYENVLPAPRKIQIGNVINRKVENNNPGPGQYPIDRSLINQPASFHQRIDQKKQDWVPGPAKYEPEKHYPKEGPQYSLRSRIDTPKDVIRAPYQALKSTVGDGLKYSLSYRPKDLAKPVTPGPAYVPPPFGSDATKCSLTSRRDTKKPAPGPGPGAYDVNQPNSGRKWSMKGRNFLPDRKDAGPGVGKYNPDYDKVLPSPRRNQILERPKERNTVSGPGYYDLGSTFSPPKITIGQKEKLAVRPGVG
ncbi:hypothetical protein TRFO_09192 [Tritrichomonas foetus]|uniref:Outer dense fiber protein 3 n=1 Tax=Tritrichomonas foetus TaxID=1144522 RepID=A0A1J4JHQ4_9EUKA|nr:hypothetical protein TRFO_09192 [Tritrichomonas foetus]|eukprot:OHS97783.1 hypothetical protein TRFO_09192 [Tritrichomonas foetus]